MIFETISMEEAGPVTTLTIRREKALNALNTKVIDELSAALHALRERFPAQRVVILTGAGEKAFVAGADIAQMAEMREEQALAFAHKGHALGAAIEALPQPVIAAVNGFALGGGTELALCCDLIYASQKARFGQPEVGIGVMPGFGGTQRLPRRVGPGRAAELIFSGEMIGAEEALRIGLVDAVLAPEELLPHARRVAEKIATRAPRAVASSKEALRRGRELAFTAGCELEARLFGELFSTEDQKEGMKAFLAKQTPAFTGA